MTGLGLNRNGKNQKAAQRRLLDQFCSQQKRGEPTAAHRRLLDWSWSQQKRGKTTAAHRRLLDQFWSLNPKGRQSTLDTAWSRCAEGVVMQSMKYRNIQTAYHQAAYPQAVVAPASNLSRTQSRGDRPTQRGQLLNDKGETFLTTGNRLTTQL